MADESNSLRVRLVSPERVLFDTTADAVELPAKNGYMEVLYGHAPLMAELGAELSLSGGGGSSAMPHKQNPVGAEVLVSLARFNAVQVSGLHQSMVHEQERSGAAWMLEWMILPQIVAATGSALHLASALVDKIVRIGTE